MRWLAAAAGCAVAAGLHTAVNVATLRRCPADPPEVQDRVAVLVPARDEAGVIADCLAALTAQRGVPDLSVTVLDDESTDATADLVRAVVAEDPRVSLISGGPLPAGWLGKPYACHRLAAAQPDADWLVFVDADVTLAPVAVAAAVTTARQLDVDLLSPFPRQLAVGPAEQLIQPLLAWSWLTLVPLRLAERSRRTSLAVAVGQFLVVRRAAYERVGGHEGVRHEVLEDLALARAIRRHGGRTTVADGTGLATCRMYEGWPELRAGYSKSLWAAFGSPPRAVAVVLVAAAVYVVPPVAALTGSRTGLIGYLAAVAGRALAARRTGTAVWPAAWAHPVSVALAGGLVLRSLWHRRRATLTWKGRPV